MLSQTQRNAIFTNIIKDFIIDGNNYTAIVTYPAHFDGEVNTPIILLNYISDPVLVRDSVGKKEERDHALMGIDIFARTDETNGVHGIKIAREIARTLVLWFKQSADALLINNGLKIKMVLPVRDLSFLEEKIFRMHFKVRILYKLI